MKFISDIPAKAGRKITIVIAEGDQLVVFRNDAYYRLGEPHDDVIQGHVLLGAKPAVWCSITQKWIV